MNTRRFSPILKRLLPIAILVMTCSAYGDVVIDGQVVMTEVRARIDRLFEKNIFRIHGSAENARVKLNDELGLFLEDIHKACTLSDGQIRKLRLAGRCDIRRFFRSVDEAKEKFQNNKANRIVERDQLLQIIQVTKVLQLRLDAGLFGTDSMLRKSLVNALNRQQFLQYEKFDTERMQSIHESKIRLVIAMLEQASPVTIEQRRKLLELFRRETKPPRTASLYHYYAIMFQISKFSEAKLKPLLDDVQWLYWHENLQRTRLMEPRLKEMGLLGVDQDHLVSPDEPLLPEK